MNLWLWSMLLNTLEVYKSSYTWWEPLFGKLYLCLRRIQMLLCATMYVRALLYINVKQLISIWTKILHILHLSFCMVIYGFSHFLLGFSPLYISQFFHNIHKWTVIQKSCHIITTNELWFINHKWIIYIFHFFHVKGLIYIVNQLFHTIEIVGLRGVF